MLSFKKLLTTTFQVLGLTGALLVSLTIYRVAPSVFLLPPLSSSPHCSTFLEDAVAAQCLIHLLHFAVLVVLEEAFAMILTSTITFLVVYPQPEKLDGVVLPLTISDAMVQATADRCLLKSGVCQNLRQRPDYLSFFRHTTNQTLLTFLERSCCGPPWCDPNRTKSSGTRHPTAKIAQESWGMPCAGSLCEARDPRAAGCYNCMRCYDAYADGLKKGWVVTSIYSVILLKLTGWINGVVTSLWLLD